MQVTFQGAAQTRIRSLSVTPVADLRRVPDVGPRFGSDIQLGLGLLPLLAGGLAALGGGLYLVARKVQEKRQREQQAREEEEMFRRLSQGGCCGFDSPERKSLNSCCKLEDPDNNPPSQ